MTKSTTAFVALGSNIEDRILSMRRAAALLKELDDTFEDCELSVASLYETLPVGGPAGQGKYLNSAIRVRTCLAPIHLMETLLEVERAMGRRRGVRWESRIIDLDLLLYGQFVCQNDVLTIPHPRMHERRFVLEPLAEIAGNVVHSRMRRTIAELNAALRASGDDNHVVRIAGPEWATG